MATKLNKELTNIVLKAIERGRKNQKELDTGNNYRDGGVNLVKEMLVKDLEGIVKRQAVAIARKLVSLSDNEEVKAEQNLMITIYEKGE